MPKKKKGEDTEADESGSKGRSKLVPAVVVALLLAGGGYFLTSGSGGDTAAVAGEAVELPAPVLGEVVALEPVTLNLADGRFLKVGLALQLIEGAAAVDAAGVAGFAAPALDEAISVLGARSYAELVAPGGRDSVKQALSERVAARYEGDVLGVYFTEFVMQ